MDDFYQVKQCLYDSVTTKLKLFDRKLAMIERELDRHQKAMKDGMNRQRISAEEEDKKNDCSLIDTPVHTLRDHTGVFKNQLIKDTQKVNYKNATFLDGREMIKFEDTLNEVLQKDLVIF